MPSRDSAILALALGVLRFSCAPLSPEEQLPLKPQLGPGKISFEPLPHPTQGPALEEKDTIMDAPPASGSRSGNPSPVEHRLHLPLQGRVKGCLLQPVYQPWQLDTR